MHGLTRFWLAAVATIAFAGCATPPSEPANLSQHKAELVRYVESGRYDEQIAAVAQRARDYVEQRAARRAPGERLALVLDVDETAVSDLPHMRAVDFGYVPAEWRAWVERGEAPTIEPVLAVYRAAVRAGVPVFFVTARSENDRASTELNLRRAGYTTYAGLVLLPAGDATRTNAGFKIAARRRIVESGYTIIANIGDQQSDLAGGYAERTFKLPNPFYLTE